MISNIGVAIDKNVEYYQCPPFDPSERYSELGNDHIQIDNRVYNLVRQALINAKLDLENAGTDNWSPFRNIIKPGNTVLIKPNLVIVPQNPIAQLYVTTHGSVIRPVLDYCWKALDGNGKIIIGDAPQAETDFQEVITRTGIKQMVYELQKRGMNIECIDFRDLKVKMENGIWVDEIEVKHHPQNTIVNLGKMSFFYNDQGSKKYCGGGYDADKTRKHHSGEIQEYKVSKLVLDADVVISMPKIKTHKKAGITCCMKNLVGINVDKDYLPHYTVGTKKSKGDEMPELPAFRRALMSVITKIKHELLYKHWRTVGRLFSRIISEIDRLTPESDDLYEKNPAKNVYGKLSGIEIFQGAWHGNETIWKMIMDLNRIFLYSDKLGMIQSEVQRKVFYIADGIICGSGNGPMEPKPVQAGLVAAGDNAYNIDMKILELFNIKADKIPLYRQASDNVDWLVPYSGVDYQITNCESFTDYKLEPPTGWDF